MYNIMNIDMNSNKVGLDILRFVAESVNFYSNSTKCRHICWL